MRNFFLITTLLLVSISTSADVGDVYFCETIKYFHIAADGEVTSFLPEKFKFKVEADEVKIAASPLMIDTSLTFKIDYLLRPDKLAPGRNFEFRAETLFSRVEFHYGNKFHFTTSYPRGIRVFIADCDTFD